jgi:hypothetical protein
MSFNSSRVQPYATGALTAFSSPLGAYKGSVIALTGITATSTVSSAGLVLLPGGVNNIEFESLSALVETNLTTSTITAATKWQVTFDGTNWIDIYKEQYAATTQVSTMLVAAAGTGTIATKQYVHAFAGINPAFYAMRLAVVVGVATGGAGDNVTVAYTWRKRFVAAMG